MTRADDLVRRGDAVAVLGHYVSPFTGTVDTGQIHRNGLIADLLAAISALPAASVAPAVAPDYEAARDELTSCAAYRFSEASLDEQNADARAIVDAALATMTPTLPTGAATVAKCGTCGGWRMNQDDLREVIRLGLCGNAAMGPQGRPIRPCPDCVQRDTEVGR